MYLLNNIQIHISIRIVIKKLLKGVVDELDVLLRDLLVAIYHIGRLRKLEIHGTLESGRLLSDLSWHFIIGIQRERQSFIQILA